MKKFTLPQLAWHGVRGLDVSLPESWQAEVYNMAGYALPRLEPAGIKKAIGHPLGMAPLREYARGKKEVAILFDDITRVTRVADIVPYVLEELAAAGLEDSRIRFIAAGGTHGAMDRLDFVKKLGEDVVARFPVYNHNPFHNCVFAGATTRGTKVYLNDEVMKCDLKIGIGSIVPHGIVGFGGGGKIVLPGVASYDTILAFHSLTPSPGRNVVNGVDMGLGGRDMRRKDIEEATSLAGLDMKIDALVNMWGETVEIIAGAPAPAFAVALEKAQKHYLTPVAKDKDVVIANAFAKVTEAYTGMRIAFPALSQQGGDVVIIANAPEGQVTHYILGSFGNNIGGPLRRTFKLPENVKRLIVYSEYPEYSVKNGLEGADVLLGNSWEGVLQLLEKDHGPGTGVAIYPNADIQYC